MEARAAAGAGFRTSVDKLHDGPWLDRCKKMGYQAMADVQWSTLNPILRDLTDRLARIEQHLASTGFQVASPAGVQDSFGGAPASFGAQESFGGTPVQPGLPGGTVGVPADLIALARAGKPILAMKRYKDMTGLSLKEAKDAIEAAVSRGY